MSAYLEEVRLAVRYFHAEYLGPDGGHGLLGCTMDRRGTFILMGQAIRVRQRLAVDLSVRTERKRIKLENAAGNHVFRQVLAHEGAQFLCGDSTHQYYVSNQMFFRTLALMNNHYCLAYCRMCPQCRFKIAQLDAEAAHLHLEINAPQVFKPAIFAPAAKITHSVQTLSRSLRKRMRHESFRREHRLTGIAAHHACPTDIDFADNAHRTKIHGSIENVGMLAAQWTANSRLTDLRRRHAFMRGEGCVLGRAIDIDDALHAIRIGLLDQLRA